MTPGRHYAVGLVKSVGKPKIRSVKFNVVMNMILTSSSFIFPLITVPYASRTLGTYGTGAVAFAQSATNYFALFALLGISAYGVRECARVRDDNVKLSKLVQELLVILVCSTTVVFGVFLLTLFTIPKFTSQRSMMLVFGCTIWLSSFGVEWFYQAIEQYGYITIRNIAFKLASLGIMFVVVRNSSDYLWYGVTTALAGYGSNIINMLRLRKLVSLHPTGKLELKRHFKPMLSFTVSSISSGLYSQIDLVMLGFIGTTSMVGLYQLAFKIKSLLVTAIGSVGNVMLPRLSYFSRGGRSREFQNLMAKNLSFITTVGLALMALSALGSDTLVIILGGRHFLSSAQPLIALAPILLLSPMNILLSQQMIATGMEKIYATINFLSLILAASISPLLIHDYGIIGAACSSSIAELAAFIARSFFLRISLLQTMRSIHIWKPYFAFLISCTIVGIIYLMLNIPDNMTLGIINSSIFIISYVFILILVKDDFIHFFLKKHHF
jgi:O-antigen/teichoic acid export membrane protein